jgi:hypothetical protein
MAQQEVLRPPPRVVTRLAIDFLLQAVQFVTLHLDGDILAGLAVLALLQGNFSQNDDKSPASEARSRRDARPVSVQSLARSLKTPPETMRRCVARLIEQDWCIRVPKKGVVISDSEAARAKSERLMADIRAAFLRMLSDLKSINFDFDLMDRGIGDREGIRGSPGSAARGRSPEASGPKNNLDRIVLDFGLRMVDGSTAPFGDDYVLTCVFAAIMSANASRIAYDPQQAWRYGAYESPPPDDERRAVSLVEISQLLAIPYETTRRYANTLIERGYCIRDERKALLIPAEVLQSPAALAIGFEIVKRFVQMVSELKRMGFDFGSITSRVSRAGEAAMATERHSADS